MQKLREILNQTLLLLERLRQMDVTGRKAFLFFVILLAFGAINGILGYRLLRFWVMLFGFATGALGAFYVTRSMGYTENRIVFPAMAVAGILLAVIAFAVYKAGIFLVGAGPGFVTALYLVHPTSSAAFFLCVLAGTILGMLALKFSKGIIIAGTSIMGGILAGYSLGKLLHQPEIPHGLLYCAGFAVLGLLIQFLINRPAYEEEEENEETLPMEDENGNSNETLSFLPPEDDEDIEWTDEMDDEFWGMNKKKNEEE